MILLRIIAVLIIFITIPFILMFLVADDLVNYINTKGDQV